MYFQCAWSFYSCLILENNPHPSIFDAIKSFGIQEINVRGEEYGNDLIEEFYYNRERRECTYATYTFPLYENAIDDEYSGYSEDDAFRTLDAVNTVIVPQVLNAGGNEQTGYAEFSVDDKGCVSR